MFKEILDKVTKEFSGINAKDVIGGIANYHRIQSSPGFRAAANFCQEKLNEYEIPFVEILTFPAKGHNRYWGNPVPKEWSIKSATLDLIGPKDSAKNLCRFFVNPCSVIQRSNSTPKDGITGEVVILPRGLEEEDMKKLELKGKFVLTDEPSLRKLRDLAIGKFGAVGIIYDLVSELKPYRTRANFPTAKRYTSFWYGTKGEEGDALGFVLSAEEGTWLRNLVKQTEMKNKKLKKEGKPLEKVEVTAKIDAEFYDGEMEVVEFFIPGVEEGQEVVAVAHLCHPKPGAVDNASGCGALIEVARTLNNLITSGQLQKPKRGIRFLLVAEFTGTFCYLATHEKKIDDFIAGINLDMVGSDQTFGGRTLIMERTHLSTPSYVNDVLSAMLTQASKEVSNFQGTGAFASFNYANDQLFSGGSDHVVFSSPDVGIGTPMFIQWPDRFYHTGEDSIEKVSPKMLQIVGSLAASYCYFLANAELPESLWIAQEVSKKGRGRLTNFGKDKGNAIITKIQSKINEKESAEQIAGDFLEKIDAMFELRRDSEIRGLESIKKLVEKKSDLEVLENLIAKEKEIITKHAHLELEQTKYTLKEIFASLKLKPKPAKAKEKDPLEEKATKLVPNKLFRGPSSSLIYSDLTYEEGKEGSDIGKKYPKMRPTLTSAMFWVDGKRTIAEIAELVEAEHGFVSIPYLVEMMQYYEKYGSFELKKKK
ncbi:MAG: DUF4910 domain-containing protein [Asgard group archaeon]|nr:DUF4910 domain-containing protein [Asgard group archaeon]